MMQKGSWCSLWLDKLWAAEPEATERKSRQVETLRSQNRGMVAHGISVVRADGVTQVAAHPSQAWGERDVETLERGP